MSWLWKKIQEKPNYVAGIVNIILIQAIAYGFTIDSIQLANWNMLIILILSFLTDQTVVPISLANSQIETAIKMPTDSTVKDVIQVEKENKENL